MRIPWRKRGAPSEGITPSGHEDSARTLDPDLPISTASEDRLGRGNFAGRLARQIELAPRAGFVVALLGPWGSGKTSVLRMVEERLRGTRAAESRSLIVVPFNPWLVSGSEQLVSQFVAELASALPQALGPSRGAKAADRLTRYADGLRTLERAPGVGWAFQVGGAFMHEAGRRLDDRPSSLAEKKEQACEAIGELDVQVVVTIDDVDRLHDAEIRELMRMIKLVGDFPNVTYLLAFDREVVRASLDAAGTEGGQYLEKIVQIEYRLPEPPPEMLEVLLLEGIKHATAVIPDYRLDTDRWEAVYSQIIRPLITRPRHVRRFTNALPLAVDLAGTEVDLVDVIALTSLHTLLPKFHDRLLALRGDLTSRSRSMLVWNHDDAAQQAAAARLNQVADQSDDPDVARAAYRLLFPASMVALSHAHTDDQTTWTVKRRIADPEAFDTYFTATLPEGVLSVTEVRGTVDAFARGPEALRAALDAQPADRLPALLRRVWGHIDDIALPDIKACLPVVDAQVERLSDFSPSVWAPADQGRAFIRDVVRLFPQGEERDAVVREKFETSRSLTSKFMWLRSIGAWEDRGDSFCSPDLVRALRKDLAAEVLSSSVDVLLVETRPAWLLRTAEDDGGDHASERIFALLEDGRLLAVYLGAFLALTGSADYELQFDELEKRQGRARLIAALGRVDVPALADDDRVRILQLAAHYADQAGDCREESSSDGGSTP